MYVSSGKSAIGPTRSQCISLLLEHRAEGHAERGQREGRRRDAAGRVGAAGHEAAAGDGLALERAGDLRLGGRLGLLSCGRLARARESTDRAHSDDALPRLRARRVDDRALSRPAPQRVQCLRSARIAAPREGLRGRRRRVDPQPIAATPACQAARRALRRRGVGLRAQRDDVRELGDRRQVADRRQPREAERVHAVAGEQREVGIVDLQRARAAP